MMDHWAVPLIGTPWAPGAEGPAEFNCWNFVRTVERDHFGVELPPIPVDEADLRACVRAFRSHGERSRWLDVTDPAEGDVVLLGHTPAYPSHVGVWLAADGGGVLHCRRPNGVVYHTPARLADAGWRVCGHYRFVGDRLAR